MADVYLASDGRRILTFRHEDVVPRPDPRLLRFGRTRIALTRTLVFLWAGFLLAGGIWLLTQGEWRGVAGLAVGLLFGIGAFVSTPDLGTGEHVRVRCPCCAYPTFLLEEDTFEDMRTSAETNDAQRMAFIPETACPLCEWGFTPLDAGDPRPDPITYELDRARQNFRAYLQYYSPAQVESWSGEDATPEEQAAKRQLMDLYEHLEQLPDGSERWQIWRALNRSTARLERIVAHRMGMRTMWLYRVQMLRRWLRYV